MKLKILVTAVWAALGDLFLNGMADHGLALFAFNPAPSAWLGSGYQAAVSAGTSTHNIILNTSNQGSNITLPLLTDALANASSGDIRSVVWAICEQLWQQWNTQGTANQPKEMTISKSVTTDPVTGNSTARYAIGVVLAPAGFSVAPES